MTEHPNRDSGSAIGRRERIASAVVGGALLWHGLERRSLGGVVAAVAGGTLVYRGLRGTSPLSRVLETDIEPADAELAGDTTTREPVVERSMTVGLPAEELEPFWKDPEQVTQLVGTVADVSEVGDTDHRHRWQVTAPLGQQFEWESELVEDQSGDHLTWQSLDGAPVPYEATISFHPAPAERGTEVTLRVQYDPPGGAVGDATMDRLGSVAEPFIGTGLRRFKALAETGEMPSLETNPSGRGEGDLV